MKTKTISQYVISGKWVLLIDTLYGVYEHLSSLWIGTTSKNNSGSHWDLIINILIVIAFLYFAIRESPTLPNAIKAILVYWFIWTPILGIFLISGDVLFGPIEFHELLKAFTGLILSLVLLSPVAILVALLTAIVMKHLRAKKDNIYKHS